MSRSGPSLRRHILPGLFVAILFVTLWVRRPDPEAEGPQLLTFSGQTMGTTFSVKLGDLADGQKGDGVADALREELSLVGSAMSTYEKDSELSRWNRRASTEPVKVSKPLSAVVKAALAVSEQSGGAFDITVQPLVDLWGFGPTRRKEKPTDQAVAMALKHVGWQKVVYEAATDRLGKQHPEVWLDLSAIAKGYAVDRISERLLQMGYGHHFVEVGGEVRARGRKSADLPWRVGVEQPTKGVARQFSFPLHNQAVATSGSYRNFRQYGEDTFSHTLDPRTGSPVTHRLISVTVVHSSCMLADAWATALAVLGPQAGLVLANEQGLSASFLHANTDSQPMVVRTEAFNSLMKPVKLQAQ